MRGKVKKVVCYFLMLLVAVILSGVAVAAEGSNAQQGPSSMEETVVPPTSLADLISSSTDLSKRLSGLERNLESVSDVSTIEEEFTRISLNLEALSDRVQNLKKSERYHYDQLIEIKATIMAEAGSLQRVRDPLTNRVRQVELWNNEWLAEDSRWKELAKSLPKDVTAGTIRPTIVKTKKTIAKALELIISHLKPLLATEGKAAEIQARIDSLVLELNDLLQAVRGDYFRKSAPSVWSSEYFVGFHPGLWDEVRQGWKLVSWPSWQPLQRRGWVVLVQVVLSLVLAVSILRKRTSLAEHRNLRFVAERPFSAGMLVGFMSLLPLHDPTLGTWNLIILIAICTATARLAARLFTERWRRQLIYVLAILLVLNEFLKAIGWPLPLLRLYILSVSLGALLLCLWGLRRAGRQQDSRWYIWALQLGVIVAVVTVAAELSGYTTLAAHLLESLLKTTLLLVAARILILSARNGLDYVLCSFPLAKIPLLRRNAAVIVERSSLVIHIVVGVLVLSSTLVIWDMFEKQSDAIRWIWSMGFPLGSGRVTLGVVLTAAAVLYAAFLASRAVQVVLTEEVLPRRKVERGAQISMARLVHYGFVLLGFLLALAALGVDLRNVTIIGGALGVGIGFGLQTIVNNFVCGLILLFERPISVGDYIEIAGGWAEIKKIGLRSTIVQTFDRADLIIPNSNLITNQVTNWTRSDRLARIKVPVGVAYGSDVPLVMKILQECAEENASVVKSPVPRIYFMGFGDSSLDFEMRIHLADIDDWFIARTAIIVEIERKFRESGIEIPFPQRDLHLRSVDPSVTSTSGPPVFKHFHSGSDEEADPGN